MLVLMPLKSTVSMSQLKERLWKARPRTVVRLNLGQGFGVRKESRDEPHYSMGRPVATEDLYAANGSSGCVGSAGFRYASILRLNPSALSLVLAGRSDILSH